MTIARSGLALAGIILIFVVIFGASSSSDPVSCISNQPPTARVIRPVEGQSFNTLQKVTLQAEASDTDGTVVSYDWRFQGESLHFTGNPVNIGYLYAGSHAFTLTVQDNGGAQTQKTVHFLVTDINANPVIPSIDPLPAYTGTDTLTLSGQAETLSNVSITGPASSGLISPPEVITTQADDYGQFHADVHLVANQPNFFSITSSRSGKTSSIALSSTIQDSIPPAMPANVAVALATQTGWASVSGPANSTEPGNQVLIENLPLRERALVTSNLNGSFNAEIRGESGQMLRILQIDPAGNVSSARQIDVPGPHWPARLAYYIVSGNHQFDYFGRTLRQPLVIKAVDAETNEPADDVPFAFSVAVGAGHLSNVALNTDENGLVQVNFQLGSGDEINVVNAIPSNVPSNVEYNHLPLHFFLYATSTSTLYGINEFIGFTHDRVNFETQTNANRLLADGIVDGTIHLNIHDTSGSSVAAAPVLLERYPDRNRDYLIDMCQQEDVAGCKTDHGGFDWSPGNGDTLSGYHYNIGTFNVPSGVTINIAAVVNGNSCSGWLAISANNVVVDGTINADAKGGCFAGNGQNNSVGGGGAGYGGSGLGGYVAGSSCTVYGGLPGGTYGASNGPYIYTGSCGGNGYFNTPGGYGGGSIKLIASTQLNMAGTISSNGAGGTYGGGGSGGGISLIAPTMTLSGTVQANGGSITNGYLGGPGGGGRVKLFSDHLTKTGTVSISAGRVSNGLGGYCSAGIGTLYQGSFNENYAYCPADIYYYQYDNYYALGVTQNSPDGNLINNAADNTSARGINKVSFSNEADFYLFAANPSLSNFNNIFESGYFFYTVLIYRNSQGYESYVFIPLVVEYQPQPPGVFFDVSYVGLAADRLNFKKASGENRLATDNIADGVLKIRLAGGSSDHFSIASVELENSGAVYHFDTDPAMSSYALGISRGLTSSSALLNKSLDVAPNRGLAPLSFTGSDTFYLFAANLSPLVSNNLFDDGNQLTVRIFYTLNGHTYQSERQITLTPPDIASRAQATLTYRGLLLDRVNGQSLASLARITSNSNLDGVFDLTIQPASGTSLILGQVMLNGMSDAVRFDTDPATNGFILGIADSDLATLTNVSPDINSQRGLPPLSLNSSRTWRLYVDNITTTSGKALVVGKMFQFSALLTVNDQAFRLTIPYVIP
jgi:hypothetical protein